MIDTCLVKRAFITYKTSMKLVLISTVAAIGIGLAVMSFTTPSTASAQFDRAAKTQAVSEVVDSRDKYPSKVVELFTSQGCSSCPPADRFIATLSDSPSTIALSFSVTYWDYLGWKDMFGKKDFTTRQKDYARYINVGNLYTPQIVLNGQHHSSRFTRKDIELSRLPDTRPLIDVQLDEQTLKIVEDADINLEDYDLKLVAYQPGMQTTPVNRGENRNRKLQNYNVVSNIYELSKRNQYSMSIKSHDDGLAYVLFASDPTDASVISVTHIGAN